MARLAAKSKGGFYATPPLEVRRICARLKAEPGARINVLDPCAGEGAALREMADALREQGAQVTAYGIELEPHRARKAKEILDRALCCGYEEARVTPGVFSFLWLNPPYNERERERSEVRFLRDLTEPGSGKLQPGSLLGYCVPQHVLEDAAVVLAVRFDGLRVYRFTDANFGLFRQVVVFGYRLARSRIGPEVRGLREALAALARVRPEELPSLNAEDGVTFEVPAAAGEVRTFRGSVTDPEEIARDLEESPAYHEALELAAPPERKVLLKPPVLPLKPTHVAVAIAAGAVGGNMGTHILVGRTKKAVIEDVIVKEDRTVTVQRERIVSTVRVFAPDGVYDLE